MAKAGLPATIGIAAFQSTTWANYFGPLNYLVAIEALLAYCIIPRARFMQTLLLNVLMICLAAAVNLFALWCAIQARSNPTTGYDSSASTICAIWFLVQVYLVNVLRSSRPQFNFPCINYHIFTMIAVAQSGPTYSTMMQAEAFIKLLLEACLTGFALAWGVALLIFPHSNRRMALSTIESYFELLGKVLMEYQGLTIRMDDLATDTQDMLKQFVGLFAKLRATDTKLKGDLEFAVRDIGYGSLTSVDLEQCYKHLRDIYIPILGLQDVAEDLCAMQSLQPCRCVEDDLQLPSFKDSRILANGVSQDLTLIMKDALQKARMQLLVETQHQKAEVIDAEKANEGSLASPSCAEMLNDQASKLARNTSQSGAGRPHSSASDLKACAKCQHRIRQATAIDQRIHFVLWHSSRAVVQMLNLAESVTSSGRLRRKGIIVPSWQVLSHWAVTMLENPESTSHDHLSDMTEGHAAMGMNHQDHRYISAHTYIEFFARRIRAIPRLLASPHSIYGFRTMCASISIGIIAYLKDTHNFFVRQRVIWALIMTMIAMKSTSGHTSFEFVLRVLASVAGTIGSFVAWYIVDGHPAGVIVFLWIYMAASFYFGVVKPRYVILGIVSAVTPIISVGYALNVQKLGPAFLQESNTPDYPIYQVAAYRLLNVIAGLAVAYIWTLFPYPITETSLIRQSMGACVFLLARYNAIVSETLLTKDRLHLTQPLADSLRQQRLDTLHSSQGYLVKLKTLSSHLKWQFSIGTELHQAELNDLIRILDRMMTHITVFGFASSTLTLEDEAIDQFSRLEVLVSSLHKVTSVLCLVAASITNKLPLPPYLFLNEAFEDISFKTDYTVQETSIESQMDANAVAVIHASAEKVHQDMKEMVDKVKVLCGELDFSARALGAGLEPQVSYESGTGRKRKD